MCWEFQAEEIPLDFPETAARRAVARRLGSMMHRYKVPMTRCSASNVKRSVPGDAQQHESRHDFRAARLTGPPRFFPGETDTARGVRK